MRYNRDMSTISELRDNTLINDAAPYHLHDKLDFITDPKRLATAQQQLQRVTVYRLRYKVGKLQVVGYLVVPRKGKNLPCLIHLRGGAGDFSRLQPKTILGQMVNYALEGYVVISTQYPGVEDGDGFDQFGGSDDLKSITRLRDILKSLSIADHTRIGMKGHSRGGLMTYMMLRDVRWIKAAVVAAAPTDQIRMGKTRPNWRVHQIRRWGTARTETIKRSPLQWADELPKKVPLLIMHGAADWRVNPLDSIEMSQSLFKHHVPHRFILFEGADHGISEYRPEYFRQSLHWFQRFLQDGDTLPNVKPHGD